MSIERQTHNAGEEFSTMSYDSHVGACKALAQRIMSHWIEVDGAAFGIELDESSVWKEGRAIFRLTLGYSSTLLGTESDYGPTEELLLKLSVLMRTFHDFADRLTS